MKLFDKKSLILLISVVSINLLCIISVSYAYFTAQIKGNETAKEMIVHAGTMEITYADTNEVSLNNALPGDSVTKQFKVENTGTLDAKYNIKLVINANDFKDRDDLIYILTKNGTPEEEKVLPYEDGYIVVDSEIASTAIDNYSLKVMFKNDLENINQNDNANKKVDFTIVVDSEDDIKLYEYKSILENNFYETMIASEDTMYDDFNNLRYVGAAPSNYIWFNCDNYDGLTQETASQQCEKWRIIGLFKNMEKVVSVSEEGVATYDTQDLVKIIRADSVGAMQWDTSEEYGSNNWTTATLKTNLEEYYTGTGIGNSKKGITPATTGMIELVKWNIGGYNSPRNTAAQFYEYERGNATYNSQPSTWDGYIGLMYPSDYGYATTGSNDESKDRAICLTTNLGSYNDGCQEKDWLYITSIYQWTIMPHSTASRWTFFVGPTGVSTTGNASGANMVNPTLYLTSNVKILDGDGSSEEPYILSQK